MDDRYLAAVGCQLKSDFFLDAVIHFRRGGKPDLPGPLFLEFDRTIIRGVSAGGVFRSHPEAMAPTDLPIGFAGFAELLGILLENVLAAGETVTNDARPDVERDDKLDI